MICRHCNRAPARRPRGLCWHCYYEPGIRDSYGPVSKYGNRGILDFNGEPRAPCLPTNALPGSPEKVAILEQRACRRERLWHVKDAMWTEGHERFPNAKDCGRRIVG